MVGPFSFWDENGYLEFHQGDVRIYRVEGEHYLFVDQTMYASTKERDWYIRNVLPFARGNVLEIGLGLGCASKVILSRSGVKKLLTIEKNENVIAAFGKPLYRHQVLCDDVYEWVESWPEPIRTYDLIFVDHYTLEDEEQIPELAELGRKLEPLLKSGGKMIFWIDENSPAEDQEQIKNLWRAR